MATIDTKTNSKGEVTSYRFRCCVGRDEHSDKQIWRTCTIKRPEGLTPKKEEKEVKRLADQWELEQKEAYNCTHSKIDRSKITIDEFIKTVWWPDHVMDGSHTPNSIAFYKNLSDDICEYFGIKKTHLNAINAETIKRYIKFLNTEARIKVPSYKEIPFTVKKDKDGNNIISWKEEKQAFSYQILRKSTRSENMTRIATTKDLSFCDNQKYRGKKENPQYSVKAQIWIPGNEPYSKTTVIRHYQTLRNILNYAIRFDYLKDDPCRKLSVKDKPHKESKSIDFLAPKDAQHYVNLLESQPLYWRCLENILITCGLRRGEAAGLQYGDFDHEKLTISVERSVSYDKGSKNKLRIGTTKTGKSRVVSMTTRISTMVEALKKEQQGKYNLTLSPSSYVFCNITDPTKPVNPSDITRWQRKFVERNHLPIVSPHDLRHSAASLALEAGANLKDVQELLGHQNPETTAEFYAAVTQEAKRRTVTGIENLLIPQQNEAKKAE